MKAKVLLVDGHSVIFQWPELSQLHARNSLAAREELIRILTRFRDDTGDHVVLVFDGRGVKVGRDDQPNGIQIFYSKDGQTADSIVERLVAKYADSHELMVATDDNLERTTVAAFGAIWISTSELRVRVGDAERDLQEQLERLKKRR